MKSKRFFVTIDHFKNEDFEAGEVMTKATANGIIKAILQAVWCMGVYRVGIYDTVTENELILHKIDGDFQKSVREFVCYCKSL